MFITRITKKAILCCTLIIYSCKSGENSPLNSIVVEKGHFCTAGPITNIEGIKIKLNQPSKRAQVVFDNIMSYAGLTNIIEIYEGDVMNALATEEKGRKIIIYNERFLKQADVQSESYWQSIFLIAHEIGHLISDHFTKTSPKSNYKKELQADEFAGFILYKLGAGKEASTWIMRTALLQSDDITLTHPDKLKRDSAIKVGWEKSFRQTFNIPNPSPPPFDAADSLDYFDCSSFRYDEELNANNEKDSVFYFYSISYPPCDIESVLSKTKKDDLGILNDPLIARHLIRDTLKGVILKLHDADSSNQIEVLSSTSATVRIQEFNRKMNPLLPSYSVVYIHDIHDPGHSEGGSYLFKKYFKPGQSIKFLISPVSTEGMVPVQKLRFLKFIPPL